MAKTTTRNSNNLKSLMWERLSESPEKLYLDRRAEEEPEDLFVRLCNTGRKKDVISALKANLCDIVVEVQKKEKQTTLRFMRRAIRLCDIISANECKPALMLILLDESGTVWGKDFEELQELAARALDGMPKETSEFEYWSYLTEKRNAILPYALNAMIEIDLDRGIQKLVKIYFNLPKTVRENTVNWEVILQLAVDTHGPKNIGDALDKVFAGDPLAFELFVRLVAKIPSLSRISERERKIEDIVSYAEEALVKEQENIELQSLLPFFHYQVHKQTTVISHTTQEQEKLKESYGKLRNVGDILFQLTYPKSWKSYPSGRNMIKSYEN